MAKFIEDMCQSEDFIEIVDHNYYSNLKPTLFMLRYLGGPTGLWRIYSKRSALSEMIRQIMAFLMLVMLNVGTVLGIYMMIINVLFHKIIKSKTNAGLFFALFLDLTAIFGKIISLRIF